MKQFKTVSLTWLHYCVRVEELQKFILTIAKKDVKLVRQDAFGHNILLQSQKSNVSKTCYLTLRYPSVSSISLRFLSASQMPERSNDSDKSHLIITNSW